MKYLKPNVLSLVLASSLLGACTGDQLSSSEGELVPVWLLDADQSTGQTDVSGLVRNQFDDNSNDLDRLGIEELINPDGTAQINNFTPFNDLGVRLSDGDVMRVTTAGSRHQLYRRDVEFVYRAQVPLDANQPDHELRLDYKDARFAPSVTVAQLFSVDGFTSPETSTIVPATGVINASWSVPALTENYLQRLGIQLLACNARPVSSAPIFLQVASGDRSVAIPVTELPRPPFSALGATNSASPSCTYELQLFGITAPVSALSPSNQDFQGSQESVETSVVILISRSAKLQLQVDVNANVNSTVNTESTP